MMEAELAFETFSLFNQNNTMSSAQYIMCQFNHSSGLVKEWNSWSSEINIVNSTQHQSLQ
jgi:hypothetical protein